MKLLFLGTWEIVAVVLVVLLLFGGKKIPEMMKGLGTGVKSFKDAVNGVGGADQKKTEEKPENAAPSQQYESRPPEQQPEK